MKAKARNKAKTKYLLSTKLTCGLCESAMVADTGTGHNNQVYNYYKCNGRKYTKTCDMKPLRKAWLEKLVVLKTMEILTDETIDFIATEAIALQERELKSQGNLGAYEEQLKETTKIINNLMAAVEQGIFTSTTKDRLQELNDQKNALESAIAAEKIATPPLTKEQIVFWLDQFKDGNTESEEFCETLIDALVNHVYVFPEKICIIYNYKDGNSTIKLSELNSKNEFGLCSLACPENEKLNVQLTDAEFGLCPNGGGAGN